MAPVQGLPGPSLTQTINGLSGPKITLTAAIIGAPGLDTNGFVPIAQMPITAGQGKRALLANETSGTTWLQFIESALPASSQNATNIAYTDAFWPIGGAAWALVKTALEAALGTFTNTQLATLQQQAITNR
jgi:hypothetical protein